MALRIAACASRISRPKNPPFISLAHNNATLRFLNITPRSQRYNIRAISSEAAVEPEISKKEQNELPNDDWKIKMLYDGDCPLCMREVLLYSNYNVNFFVAHNSFLLRFGMSFIDCV